MVLRTGVFGSGGLQVEGERSEGWRTSCSGVTFRELLRPAVYGSIDLVGT